MISRFVYRHAAIFIIAFGLWSSSSRVTAADTPAALTALRTSYEKAVERATAGTKETYLKELQKLRTAFSQAGDLDSTLAVDGEIKGQPVPNTIFALGKLKDQYQSARANAAAPVTATYRQELTKLKIEFTKSGNLDDAVAVDAELKAVAAGAAPTGASTGSDAAKSRVSTTPPGSAAASLTSEAGKVNLATLKPNKMVWKPLKKDTLCFSNSDKYVWSAVPPELEGVRFNMTENKAPVLDFTVAKGGLVFIATSTRWQNSGSGGAGKDALDEAALEAKGWHHVPEFDALSRSDTGGNWRVFCKQCNADESWAIRTEKYSSPVLLVR